MPILSARQLSKSYGNLTLFADVAVTVRRRERIGLLGVNGTGKSTLLSVLAGKEPADAGTIDRRRDARIGYLSQEPELDPSKSPRELVEEGMRDWFAARERHRELSQRVAESSTEALVLEQAQAAETIERLGGWGREHLAEQMLQKLGIASVDGNVGTMSGGEKRRVALARLLVESPDLAILDEPTNHLDADTIEWLEGYLLDEFKGAVLLVTHDRYVLDTVCERILELEAGKLTEFAGNYGDYLEQKADLLAHADRVERNRLNFVRRETAWLMRGARARTTKQKARIQRARAVIDADPVKARGMVRFEADSRELGGSILDLEDVSASVAGGHSARVEGPPLTLFSGLTLRLTGGSRIGIVGPNGAGKTTLLKIISGDLEPTLGRVVRGAKTKLAYFEQARSALEATWSVFDNVAGRQGAERDGAGVVTLGGRTVELRTYLEQFLFDVAKQRQLVGSLSGGERARVALAKVLKEGANLLLLDEPTNDLDIQTLGALEDFLDEWSGCAIVVSHDRYFLNRVTTGILAMKRGEPPIVYAGNYDAYRLQAVRAVTDSNVSQERSPSPAASSAGEKRRNSGASEAAPKLTYAERLELESIMDRIGEAESAVAAVQAKLSEPGQTDFQGLARELQQKEAEVLQLTARWEELESKKAKNERANERT